MIKEKSIKLSIDKWEIALVGINDNIRQALENNDFFNYQAFHLTRQDMANGYKHNFLITLETGEIYGNLYFDTYRINRDDVYIYVNNKMLYNVELGYYTQEIIEKLNPEKVNNSILDLSLDFDYNIIRMFYYIIRNKDLDIILLNKKYGMNDKIKDLLCISNGTRKNIHLNKSFYINNKEKGLTLALYNKSQEIEDNDNEKEYIKDYLNFNDNKKIYRMEIRTRHKLLKDTLTKIGFTDEYIFDCIIRRIDDELLVLFRNLLERLIRIEYKSNTYSLLDMLE